MFSEVASRREYWVPFAVNVLVVGVVYVGMVLLGAVSAVDTGFDIWNQFAGSMNGEAGSSAAGGTGVAGTGVAGAGVAYLVALLFWGAILSPFIVSVPAFAVTVRRLKDVGTPSFLTLLIIPPFVAYLLGFWVVLSGLWSVIPEPEFNIPYLVPLSLLCIAGLMMAALLSSETPHFTVDEVLEDPFDVAYATQTGEFPAGWYTDPSSSGTTNSMVLLRYWDGNQWTEHTHRSQI